MLLSIHVDARGLPSNASYCYARLSTTAETRYTCRQHSRNPSWPTCLLISERATGNVHLSIHTQVSPVEDGLLGLLVLNAESLRSSAPTIVERTLPNGAIVFIRVENVRKVRENHHFTIAVMSSRLRRRIVVGSRRIPLALVIFRASEIGDSWVPVYRAHGCVQGNAVFFDDAELDIEKACLGALARTLRIALYRVDVERKYKLVAFFETAFTALQMLPVNDKKTQKRQVVTQPLQGRFYDDQPGLVTFARTTDENGQMRISIRFDVFNGAEFVSSYARPRRYSLKLSESFDEGNRARSRRLRNSFSVSAADRVEKSIAFDRPPPSLRSSRYTSIRT